MNQIKTSLDIGADLIPEILPILPIVDTNLFPKMVLPLVLMQEEAIELIDETMAGSRILGLLLSRRSDINSRHSIRDLHKIGTVAIILKMARIEDNKAQLLIQGVSRFKVSEYVEGKSYMQARVNLLESRNLVRDKETRALMEIGRAHV